MKQDMTLKQRFPKTAMCIVLIIAILWGMVPLNNRLTAQAATVPTVTVSTGTLWKYSQKDDMASVSRSTASTSSSAMTTSLSGRTVTLKESSANMTYSMGYVPIIVSVNVPANTTYRTTMHFNITGSPNKSNGKSSALAYAELFDLGSTDKSSSLTFNTNTKDKNAHSSSYTLVRDVRETNNFTGSGDVSVSFENTSSSEKTVSHYFGFFSGCMSGSKYTHQVEAKCALSFEKLVESGAAPVINVKSSDVRYNLNNTKRDSYSKDKFVTEETLKSMTSVDDVKIMGLSVTNIMFKLWEERLAMSASSNKLSFSVNARDTVGRMSYVPFTVPITVPAYTERTYYLSFNIDYERNTGSGAGFFAELIEGDVPNSFNTSASANMTGNTKLRVYSDGGDAHSGSVTVPLILKNDTDSAKTMSGNYVFFAGYRTVGAYTPSPVYNLTLENIGYASYEDTYYAAVNAQNCTYTHNSVIKADNDYNATITPNTGYSLPSTVTVKCGGTTLSTSQYTWNSGTGKLNIASKNIRGGIVVTANGVPNKYSITYSGLTGATFSAKPTTHTYGTTTTVGNPTKTGCTFAGWKINGGATVTKDLKLSATAYTANISLEATWTVNKYSATFSGTNVTKSTGFGTNTVTYNTAWTGKFTANTGCDLPPSVTVKVGGTALASSKYTYSKSGSTGTVTIAAANVTGEVNVTASGTLKKYDAALSGTNITASSGFGTGTATYKTAWTGTLKAASGYVLPDSITVKVGGTTLTTSNYTYSKSTGKVTITAAYVTGNITVTAEGHKHSYTSTVTTPATCTANGVRTYTCGCGHSYTETITKTEHSYANEWNKDDTYHWRVCTKCGAAGTKSAHVWNDGAVTTEPTETSTGIKTFTCTTCSATKTETIATLDHTHNITDKDGEWSGADDDEHWHECADGCGEKVDPEAHTLKQTEHIDPTCTQKGCTKYICEKCNHEITVDIEAVEHNFSDEWKYDDTNHYHVCTICHTETSGTEEHKWDSGTVEKLPDCTNMGVIRYECTVCGANKIEDIPVNAEAHDWGDRKISADPTKENKGTIQSVCNINSQHVKTAEIPALTDNVFWKLIDLTVPSCTEEGYEVYECEYGQVTVTNPTTEHTPVTDKRKEPTCTETGLTEGSHCGVCSKVLTEQKVVDAFGHRWNDGKVTTPPTEYTAGIKTYTCTVCGAQREETLPALAHKHTWSEVYSTDETHHWFICTKCGENGERKDYGEHIWNDGEITKQPTADETGERLFKCTVCGKTKTEVIPALGGGSKEPTTPDSGKIETEVQPSENAPTTDLATPKEELIEAALTEEEQKKVDEGTDIKIILKVEDATEKVPDNDKTAVTSEIGKMTNYNLGQYLDVTLLKIIGNQEHKITATNGLIRITFEIPSALRGKSEYSVIRVHGGTAAILSDLDSDPNTVTIETDKFSTYALVFKEKNTPSNPGGNTSGGNSGDSPNPPTSTPDESDNSDDTPSDDDNPSKDDSSDTTSSESKPTDEDNSDDTSSDDSNAASSDDGNTTSSESDTSSNVSDHSPSESSLSENNGNPSTGIAVSLIPLVTAVAVLTAAAKRKKR